jgi:hypothetical protein
MIRFCRSLAILAVFCRTLANPAAALDMSGVLAWDIPEGRVERVEDGRGNVVWPVNPYVTNGLIAMWDGIWNVGMGRHDSTSTNWVDLVDGKTAALTGSCSFEANAFHLPGDGAGCAKWAGTLFGENYTLEVIVSGENSGARWPTPFGCASDKYSLFWYQHQWIWKGNNAPVNTNSRPTFESDLFKPIAVVCDSSRSPNLAMQFVDGTLSATGTHAQQAINDTWMIGSEGNSDTRFKGDIYAVRIYNRPLAADEIARNATIDRIRFGTGE